MYSDRIGMSNINRKRSIKDRLGSNADRLIGQERQVKRPRLEDGKWMHDMYQDEHVGVSASTTRQNASQDLRLKLSRKSRPKDQQGGTINKVSSGETVKDSREKGSLTARVERDGEHPRLNSTLRGSTGPAQAGTTAKSVGVSGNQPAQAKHVNAPTQGKRVAVEGPTVATLLQSLGLSKYLISFQAEEVDMAALRHMNDDDLKELGVPMGPRKKILLALASRS